MKDRRGLSDRALTTVELAAIDLAITAKQAAGFKLGRIAEDDDDDPQAQQAEGRAEAFHAAWEERHGGLEARLDDKVVLRQIVDLSAQLSERASLATLVALRGEVMSGPG